MQHADLIKHWCHAAQDLAMVTSFFDTPKLYDKACRKHVLHIAATHQLRWFHCHLTLMLIYTRSAHAGC